jgi:hypothetical protein
MDRVMDKLHRSDGPSHDEIAFLLRERAAAVPRLHAILEDASHWSQLPDESWNAQLHALFLLAALEAPEGLEPTLRLLRKPREFVDDFFGDLLTECLSWALARLGKTNPDALKALAADQTLDPYLRSAAARGLMAQALVWPQCRPRVIRGLGELLMQALGGTDPNWPALLVGDAADLAAPELRPAIDGLFESQRVNPQFIRRRHIDSVYRTPPSDLTETMDVFRLYEAHLRPLTWTEPDVTAALATDPEFEEPWDGGIELVDEEATAPLSTLTGIATPRTKSGKVGRNEPCPCGSGTKHKKCCLDAPSERVLERLLTHLGSAMTIEQLKAAIREAIPVESPTNPTDILGQALRREQEAPGSIEFDSDAQSHLFLRHFKTLWNSLGTHRL